MEESDIIYPFNGLDVIPVKANEIICFWKEQGINDPWIRLAVKLKDSTILQSNRYTASEANNLLRTLLKNKDFVFVKQTAEHFYPKDSLVRISGVRFSAIDEIGNVDYIKYDFPSTLTGELVKHTAEQYRKWKETQKNAT